MVFFDEDALTDSRGSLDFAHNITNGGNREKVKVFHSLINYIDILAGSYYGYGWI